MRTPSRAIVVLGLLALGTVPFPFLGQPTRLLLGIPTWLWWSAGFTVALALTTAWVILRWDDDGST